MSKIRRRPKSFEVLVAKALNNFPLGWHRSLLKGSGDEFESVRPWQSGDKRVAMAATAKTGEVMAKVFQEPKQMTVWLAVDNSRSMTFGGSGSAIEAAAVISSAFCLSARKVSDLVGVIAFDNQVRWLISPNEGLNVKEIGQRLLACQPPLAKTNLAAALERLMRQQLEHSLIVIISDFLFPLSEKDVSLLRQLNSFNSVTVLALVLDQKTKLAELKQSLLLTVEDAETAKAISWSGVSALANALGDVNRRRRQKLKQLLSVGGVEYLMIDIDNDYIRQLNRFFLKKRRYRV